MIIKKDSENICLKCVTGYRKSYKFNLDGFEEPLTACSCFNIEQKGPNRGYRKTCAQFEKYEDDGLTQDSLLNEFNIDKN